MTGISKCVVCLVKLCQTIRKNHLNNKWLPWKQNKRYLVYFTLSSSLKSTNSLQNFKSLRVRVLEITGGRVGSNPPPPLSIRCGYQTSHYGKG